MKIRNKIICDIYIILWCFYYLQGFLFSVEGGYGKVLLAILIVISIYYFIIANIRYRLPNVLKILTILIVGWTIYGIIPFFVGVGQTSIAVPEYAYLRDIYISLLPIYTFYVFSCRGWLLAESFEKWIVIFVLVAIAYFYSTQNMLIKHAVEYGSSQEDFTNNAAYVMLSIMPLLPLLRRKLVLQYIVLAVILYYLIIGFKRGAIIAGGVCLVFFLYESFRNRGGQVTKSGWRRLLFVFLLVLLVLGIVSVVNSTLQMNDYFNARVESTFEGDTSGRDGLYSFFFRYFVSESNVLTFLFGNGAYGTIKLSSNFAHNDWLEIAIDNGLIMLIFYAIYWICHFNTLLRMRRQNNTIYLMVGLFVIIYFIRSFISMSYGSIPMFSSLALGFGLAYYYQSSRDQI